MPNWAFAPDSGRITPTLTCLGWAWASVGMRGGRDGGAGGQDLAAAGGHGRLGAGFLLVFHRSSPSLLGYVLAFPAYCLTI